MTAGNSPSRFKPALQGSVSDRALLPDGIASAPEEVQRLNDEGVRLYGLYQKARSEAFAARDALKRAPALDRAEDAEAHALGKPLGKHQHETKARQAQEATARRQQAAQDSYNAVQLQFIQAVHDARESWLPAQEEAVANVQGELRHLLQQVSRAFDNLADETRVLEALKSWPEGGRISGLAGFRRDVATTLESKRVETRERLEHNATLKPNDMVSPDTGTLLAALGLKVDPAKPVPPRSVLR